MSKCGGIRLRSGIHTTGAQHISSLAKCSEDIEKLLPHWDGPQVAMEATEWWLKQEIGTDVEVKSLFDEIRRGVYDGNVTSLSQKCEARQAERVRNRMTSEDKLHALSNEGPGCAWVRITPLKWKKWGLKPKQWIVAARRRLNLLVSPYQIKCRLCRGGRCDVKGEHQVTCAVRVKSMAT